MKRLSRSNQILAWTGIVVVALIVATLAVGGGSITNYAADTPEGVVQRYLDAVLDGDSDQAVEYLTRDQRDRCEEDEFFRFGRDISARVALTEADVDGDSATVAVRVTEGSAGLFDSYEYSHDETYRLIRLDGAWLIDQVSWPWIGC